MRLRARYDARRPDFEKAAQAHEQKQLQIMRAAGIKVQDLEQEHLRTARDLNAHLEQVRPALAGRTDSLVADAKNRSVLLDQFGPQTLIVAATGFYLPPDPGPPVVSSGWVFSNASRITLKATDTGSGTGWGATAQPPPAPHDLVFTFIPAQNGAYNLNAVLAFHGFYILRADDGWLTHKYAEVTLNVSMNVHQYQADLGWQSFPSPLHQNKDNANELDSYDQTKFFDVNANLRGGDAVVVTVRLTVEAVASGSGSYAEINFADGTANYAQPLFLSVTPA